MQSEALAIGVKLSLRTLTDVSSEEATQMTSTSRRMTTPRAIRLRWAAAELPGEPIRFMMNMHSIVALCRLTTWEKWWAQMSKQQDRAATATGSSFGSRWLPSAEKPFRANARSELHGSKLAERLSCCKQGELLQQLNTAVGEREKKRQSSRLRLTLNDAFSSATMESKYCFPEVDKISLLPLGSLK